MNINFEISINDLVINNLVKGFILNYKSIDYIITLHQYYPLDKIKVDDVDANIIINSSWNELLILKNNTDYEEKIKNFKLALPVIGEDVFCESNNLVVSDYSLVNLYNLPFYPRILYLKLKNDSNKIYYPGLPVFQKDGKLIGIVSSTIRNEIFVLPSYYIIKSLKKSCNDKIYGISLNEQIKKINKYNVNDEKTVYHNALGIKIPIDVYFMLEGDINKTVLINKNIEKRYQELNNFPMGIERYLLIENNNYIVNATLLIVLKTINNRIISNFINFIKIHIGENIQLSITKQDFSSVINNLILDDLNIEQENMINQETIIDDAIYYIKMFV
jgi:hypothetical protein